MGRPVRILIAVAGVAASAAAIDGLYRRFLRESVLTWGATAEEAARRLPGDDLLDPADIVATRAIGTDASDRDRRSSIGDLAVAGADGTGPCGGLHL